MIRIKPHLKDLYRTDPDKISRKGCLRLDKNEGIPGLSDDFIKGVVSCIDPDFLSRYPEYGGLPAKIAAVNNLEAGNICLSNGSDAAIKYIFDAYVSAGDGILLTDPTFAMYPIYCEMFGARPVTVEYKSDMAFPFEGFMDKLSSEVRAAVIVNPNNPTGSLAGRDLLISVIDKAARNDTLVIIDEAYFYFNDSSMIEEVKNYENLIVLRTFSKLFSIAAVRLGYAAASARIVTDLKRVKPTYDVNSMAALFGEKILENPDIIRDLMSKVRGGKDYLVRRLSEENIEYRDSRANFILIRCPGRADEMVNRLAGRKILVGGGFKQAFLKDYIRITVGDEKVMSVFWDAFIRIWKTGDKIREENLI